MTAPLKVLDLFSGIGGFSLGLERAGHFQTVAFCEINPFGRTVLNKHWPDVPVLSDVREINGHDFRGSVDLVCGGFPCQDVSRAGQQAGITDSKRSSLYGEMLRIIGECRPQFAIFENVAGLLTGDRGRWFAQFLYDVAALGYDAEWHCIQAAAFGAGHIRDRVWIVIYPNGQYGQGNIVQESPCLVEAAQKSSRELTRAINAAIPADDYARMRADNDAFSGWVDQLTAYGNAIVPDVAEFLGRQIIRAVQS